MDQEVTCQKNEPAGREPLDPTLGLGEFANQMILLADIGQSDLAEILDVHNTEVSNLMTGRNRLSGRMAHRFQNMFSLSDEEMTRLIQNDVPRQYVKPVSAHRSKYVRQQRVAAIKATLPELDDTGKVYDFTGRAIRATKEKQNALDVTPVQTMLGAFAVRAEQGPPLNEAEVSLIKFLIERSGAVETV